MGNIKKKADSKLAKRVKDFGSIKTPGGAYHKPGSVKK